MLNELEAWIVVTILLVEGVRRWRWLPSWTIPYTVFPVAWFVVFMSSLGNGLVQAAVYALGQTTIVGLSAIVVYDLAGKPVKKKLIPKIRDIARKLRRVE